MTETAEQIGIKEKFMVDGEAKTFSPKHRATINFNIGKYNTAVKAGLRQYANHEQARTQASYIKSKTINNLDYYLTEWEQNFTARGSARDYQDFPCPRCQAGGKV